MTTIFENLTDPALYFNRERSWLRFNEHVLNEVKDPLVPLLERIRFLAIFANNLDEFFMIRVAGLHHQIREGYSKVPPDGMNPLEQVDSINQDLIPLIHEQMDLWHNKLIPELHIEGIIIHTRDTITEKQRKDLRSFFSTEIFPVLTPLAFDKSHPFPFISNLALNLAVILRSQNEGTDLFARVKIPNHQFPRLLPIPGKKGQNRRMEFIFLEDVISDNLDLLFPGLQIQAAYPFRITRDADLEIEEDEADDLISAVEQSISRRWEGIPVRIEVDHRMSDGICEMMGSKFARFPHMIYRFQGPVGMADLFCLTEIERPDLKYQSFIPSVPHFILNNNDLFGLIKNKDFFLFHPYESFDPVISLLEQAAVDPGVLAIKMTLYRTGKHSPVVRALLNARELGKAVSVMVELKARFDEESNIEWAKSLERAGAHVVYGICGLKVHAKLCLIVRKEQSGIVRYIHLGTGNYNATTAKVYTDIGLFTANNEIADDVSYLFNVLTGYSNYSEYRHLLVSPNGIKSNIIRFISEEVDRHLIHGDGKIIMKINALQDDEIIRALYLASQAGVRVELQIRGICCLKPGIPGLSENISVSTIVGRFLEHTRIFYFHNGGDPIILMGSADMMPRNLIRRIEILYPVLDPDLRKAIIEIILQVHMKDNVKSCVLQPDGTYIPKKIGEGEERIDAQQWMLDNRGIWNKINT